jgi:hypothetical protein
MPVWYIDQAATAPLQLLPNSLFIYHPTNARQLARWFCCWNSISISLLCYFLSVGPVFYKEKLPHTGS